MDIENIIRLIDAVGSSWSAIALLVLVGMFLLLWKYGRDLIKAVQANTRTTNHISKSIVTNHGSKNIGDAVDRLTSKVAEIDQALKDHIGSGER